MSDHRLSDLQYAVMSVLWEKTEATVADVHAALYPERGLAPTTVATLLSRLEKRDLVGHRTDGRQFVYRSLVSEDAVRRSMVSELADLLFSGDVTELVSHLLDDRQITEEDLDKVRAMIEEKTRGKQTE